MATFINFLCALLFFACLIHGGTSQCSKGSLTIAQEATGNQVQGKPEWKVTINNSCFCVFLNVVLTCGGFQTQEAIDPSILSQQGEDCIINGGNPIDPNSSLSFNYAWDNSFPFALKDAQVGCS